MIKDHTNTYFMLTQEEWEYYQQLENEIENLMIALLAAKSEEDYRELLNDYELE